jgi:hypothetical protein
VSGYWIGSREHPRLLQNAMQRRCMHDIALQGYLYTSQVLWFCDLVKGKAGSGSRLLQYHAARSCGADSKIGLKVMDSFERVNSRSVSGNSPSIDPVLDLAQPQLETRGGLTWNFREIAGSYQQGACRWKLWHLDCQFSVRSLRRTRSWTGNLAQVAVRCRNHSAFHALSTWKVHRHGQLV